MSITKNRRPFKCLVCCIWVKHVSVFHSDHCCMDNLRRSYWISSMWITRHCYRYVPCEFHSGLSRYVLCEFMFVLSTLLIFIIVLLIFIIFDASHIFRFSTYFLSCTKSGIFTKIVSLLFRIGTWYAYILPFQKQCSCYY